MCSRWPDINCASVYSVSFVKHYPLRGSIGFVKFKHDALLRAQFLNQVYGPYLYVWYHVRLGTAILCTGSPAEHVSVSVLANQKLLTPKRSANSSNKKYLSHDISLTDTQLVRK